MDQELTVSLIFGDAAVPVMGARVTSSYFGSVVKSYTDGASYLLDFPDTGLALDRLGISTVRFPGGTEGESPVSPGFFDLGDNFDIKALQRAIDFCVRQGHNPINFTVPGNIYFDKSDPDPANWTAHFTHRQQTEFNAFFLGSSEGSANSLKRIGFFEYARLHNVDIESIHIGNEFVHELGYAAALDGSHKWLGYAKVAAFLMPKLDAVYTKYLNAPNQTTHFDVAKPQIVIEGAGYNGGPRSIADNLNGQDSLIGGVDLRLDTGNAGDKEYNPTGTLNLTWETYFSSTATLHPLSYEDRLESVIDQWRAYSTNTDLNFRVDAWSYITNEEGPSLRNAALGMLQLHTFSLLGITSATNYIAIGPDKSALMYGASNDTGLNCEQAITAGGELFAMMSSALRDTEAIRLANTPLPLVEATQPTLSRAFVGDHKAILYVVNRLIGEVGVDLNISPMTGTLESFVGGVRARNDGMAGFIKILGNNAIPDPNDPFNIRDVAVTDIQLLTSVGVDLHLSGYEIAQIRVRAQGNFGDKSVDQLNDSMVGGNRADNLHGLSGEDYLAGAGGDDIIAGGDGNDMIYGGSGNDLLFGGDGADRIDGGVGIDTVSFAFATAGVRVDATKSATNTGQAAGDVYVGVEHVTGSGFDDILHGGAGVFGLTGGAGADKFLFMSTADFGMIIDDFTTSLANPAEHDLIAINTPGFGNMTDLTAGQLINNTTGHAETSYSRFIFDTTTRVLTFDPDGTGIQAEVPLATLTGVSSLAVGDFLFFF